MIQAALYVTEGNELCGFRVSEHGEGIVCAAVSALCLNAVNSLEGLTDCGLAYRYNKKGGYVECLLPGILAGEDEPMAGLLLRSLAMGLEHLKEIYGIELRVEQKPREYKLLKKKGVYTFKR